MTRKTKVLEQEAGYKVQVTGRHVQVTDAMKNYAIEKISKLERLAPRIIDVTVIMDIQRYQHKVEIIMKYGPTLITSKSSTPDMYISVDQAVSKLEAQLKKYLSRIHEHHGKGYEEKEIPELVYEVAYFAEEADTEDVNAEILTETDRKEREKNSFPRIVKTEKQPLSILTNEEAIMKLELSGASVLVFRGEEDNKLKVIYRRDDGNCGIILAE